MQESSLIVNSSPHLRSEETTRRIMLDVCIALVPAVIAGILAFGAGTLLIIATSIITAVVAEYLTRRVLKRSQTVGDMSAVVTGLLLALCLPPTINPLYVIAGSAIAIILVKQLFGGLGQNFMNPALAARIIMLIAWAAPMTRWAVLQGSDLVSTATPLGLLKENITDAAPTYIQLFMGNIGGSIGETSALALILGGAYLLVRKVISWEIPTVFIATVALLSLVLGRDVPYQLFAGGLMLGAFFMATDYSTSPTSFKGRVIMGLGCGLLTVLIRFYTGYPEGVAFAILLMNICTPLIDRYTIPARFGGKVTNA